jgi:iron complex outermembrane recepter protein
MSLYRSFPFSVFTAATLAAQSVTPPSDPVVELDPIVVSASPNARTQADLISSTSVLSGADLAEARQPTLGETLAALPGVSSTYFGPGASRPILRGLGANRVRVLANSTDTLDASNTSPDHAVSVEPFLIKRIEVVRGPASLLYGSSAVGGVVNIIDHRIEAELPDRPVSGVIDSSITDNGQGYATGGIVDVAFATDAERQSGFVLHLDAFRREADDLDVPGASGQVGAPRGTLGNSALDSKGGSVGLSYVSPGFDAGVNFNGFDSFYGIPYEDAAEVVDIELSQRRIDAQMAYKQDFGVFEEARAKVGYADYRHEEFEGGAPGTVFESEGFDSRLELINGEVAGWTGALGTQFGSTELSAVGAEAFIPTHTTDSTAVFLFQERTAGANTWQLGSRLEHRRIEAAAFRAFGPRSDSLVTLGGSAGLIRKLDDTYRLFGSFSYTERAPNGQELFADGPHHGTGAYEIGDPDLAKERSYGFETGLRKTQGFVTGSLTGFVNFFDGYIFEEASGLDVNEDNLPPGPGDETLAQTFFVQRDAVFYGFEAEAIWHLHQNAGHTLDFTTGLDYVRATDTDGNDLPRISPLKVRVALDWRLRPWHVGTDLLLIAKQTNSTPEEGDTDGYALLGFTVGYRLSTSFVTYDFFVRASNLLDEEARAHTSFLKDIAPLPGRAFTAGVSASF